MTSGVNKDTRASTHYPAPQDWEKKFQKASKKKDVPPRACVRAVGEGTEGGEGPDASDDHVEEPVQWIGGEDELVQQDVPEPGVHVRVLWVSDAQEEVK